MALEMQRGQRLRVIDIEGEQVVGLVAFARRDIAEWLSNGRSFDYNGTIAMTYGSVLYSNQSNPMFTILEDTVGRHDFLLAACSPEMFKIQYGYEEGHPSCLENLAIALAPYGIEVSMIPTPFNIFMNVEVRPGGSLVMRPPCSKAGDSITLRAEMDLLVAVSTCSAGICNNYRHKPIDLELYR